ncbi:DUF3703 domain-containing protein [Alcanivorax sp. S6407]|uniref:DUF3703 domain-containing protein n=1 Tax=Alcanivorax sp. S6407 TaxID=2926424 RepID=UPI001FF3BDF3|nr:DUF3703 domain-containing protein [Alcanivorax sp. S6407]MCK0153742.1 DUF3703 domain-containing protein [Alcanivorax sp. S6407]
MNDTQRQAFRQRMALAQQAYHQRRWQQAFTFLEQAHILGQRSTRAHTLSHWWMLKVGWRQRDWREVRGQWLRLPAALLMSRLWVPEGNTGGANVSPLQPMAIPEPLKTLMEVR